MYMLYLSLSIFPSIKPHFLSLSPFQLVSVVTTYITAVRAQQYGIAMHHASTHVHAFSACHVRYLRDTHIKRAAMSKV